MEPVVARDDELRSLQEFIEATHDGLAALVLEGEAGIGKTTLWSAAVEAASARPPRLLVARPAETERDLAYAGLSDLLGNALDDVLPGLPEPRRRALEIALLLAEADGRAPDRRAVAVAVSDALRSLGPVLVAIDDVQWLDVSSASALEFALRRLLDAPVLVLLARRGGEPGAAPEDALPGESGWSA